MGFKITSELGGDRRQNHRLPDYVKILEGGKKQAVANFHVTNMMDGGGRDKGKDAMIDKIAL